MSKGRKVPPPFDVSAFVAERDAALLSMDEQRLRHHFRTYSHKEMPDDMPFFWTIVHKARTAATSLPMEARIESKRWLLAHGSQSMDDGDIPS